MEKTSLSTFTLQGYLGPQESLEQLQAEFHSFQSLVSHNDIQSPGFYLEWTGQGHQITCVDEKKKWRPIKAAWCDLFGQWQSKPQSGPLRQSLGKQSPRGKIIYDLTCGLGKDSLFFLSWGMQVEAFERNDLIFLLLREALVEALKNDDFANSWGQRLLLHHGEATNIKTLTTPQIIYYDPMYPIDKVRKALPNKEMQFFHDYIGADCDQIPVFEWAMQTASEKVIVKRPKWAPALAEPVGHQYSGKSTRYDMYPT